jgi:hypothetical protein
MGRSVSTNLVGPHETSDEEEWRTDRLAILDTGQAVPSAP